MRTGHSVYGTFHANTVEETGLRLSSPPIEIPKINLSSIGLICVQHRNRTTNKRYTLQIAEIEKDGTPRVLVQYNTRTRTQEVKNKPKRLFQILNEFYGITEQEFNREINMKIFVLEYLKNSKIYDIDTISKVINMYYKNKQELFQKIQQSRNKKIQSQK